MGLLLAPAMIACGGKVVFVEADGDGEPKGGGSPPVSNICETLCQGGACPPSGVGSCSTWCEERVDIAGECAAELESVLACFVKSGVSDQCSIAMTCPAEAAIYEVCTVGCSATPSCDIGINQTVCRVSCSSDFEWTCTQGFPETCTCAVNGQVLGTCVAEGAGSFAVCCDGLFAANQ